MNALMLIWMSGVLPFLLAGQQPSGAQAATAAIENGNFRFTYDERGISGLANPHDPFGATLVPSATPGGARGQSAGAILSLSLSYRVGNGDSTNLKTRGPKYAASPGTSSYQAMGRSSTSCAPRGSSISGWFRA
jgi:hypothetical protein